MAFGDDEAGVLVEVQEPWGAGGHASQALNVDWFRTAQLSAFMEWRGPSGGRGNSVWWVNTIMPV